MLGIMHYFSNIDGGNDINRDCLKFSFTDVIQADLNRTMDAWNTHRIRPGMNSNNGIPDQLYFNSLSCMSTLLRYRA